MSYLKSQAFKQKHAILKQTVAGLVREHGRERDRQLAEEITETPVRTVMAANAAIREFSKVDPFMNGTADEAEVDR